MVNNIKVTMKLQFFLCSNCKHNLLFLHFLVNQRLSPLQMESQCNCNKVNTEVYNSFREKMSETYEILNGTSIIVSIHIGHESS